MSVREVRCVEEQGVRQSGELTTRWVGRVLTPAEGTSRARDEPRRLLSHKSACLFSFWARGQCDERASLAWRRRAALK